MSPPVAVCLLTCGREEYTERTLQSFWECNDRWDFQLLHADDASLSDRNVVLAKGFGFDLVYRARKRSGQMAAFRALVAAADARRCPHVLYLENDWEWVAPFPWDLLAMAAECVRLYGAQKQRDGSRPSGAFLMGTHRRIEWCSTVTSGVEAALAHVGGPPSVIETRRALQLAELESFKAVSLATGLNPLRTLRPVENVVWHIGDETTAGFVP